MPKVPAMNPLRLDSSTARRFMRRALLLDEPAPDLASALAHHGYIQIDPINVCGRMHDLILRNRVRGYREGDLMRHLHGGPQGLPAARRLAFEHHLPTEHTLVALTLDAWPYLLAAMRRRTYGPGSWSGRLSPKQKELSVRLLAESAARGPLSSEDFADTGRSRAVWGAATQAKNTLQKLLFHGRLLIDRRGENNRRYYDLPERVLPSATLELPEPSRKEIARWEVLLKLRQRRLTPLKRTRTPARGRPRPAPRHRRLPHPLLPQVRPAPARTFSSQPSALSCSSGASPARPAGSPALRPPGHPRAVEFRLHLGGLHPARQTETRLLRAAPPRRPGTRRSR